MRFFFVLIRVCVTFIATLGITFAVSPPALAIPGLFQAASGAHVITDINAFLTSCPDNDPATAEILSYIQLSYEGVPLGPEPCTEPVPLNVTPSPRLLYLQVLRVAYYMDQTKSGLYPWTSGTYWAWLKSKIGGIDITSSPGGSCCDTPPKRLPTIILSQGSSVGTGYPFALDVLNVLSAGVTHEARHADGRHDHVTCLQGPLQGVALACDQDLDPANLSAYGVAWWMFNLFYTGAINVGVSCTPDLAQVSGPFLLSGQNSLADRFVGIKPPIVAAPPVPFGFCIQSPLAMSVDLNQHGLTGSWFEPATSGQGILAAVSPNALYGAGSIFVGWFTYDTVIGGAERQRWYSAQGGVVTGQPNALLTIYQNTGGNFDSPPVTHLETVGYATLSFDTCSSGQLSYIFTDGTGRSGTIPLTRLMQNVTCSTTTPYPTNGDFALSGTWYEFSTAGQGFVVEVNPNSAAFFLAWYTYMPNGTAAGAAGQRWYSGQGAFTPGMRSVPVTIYETSGGMFDAPTPPGQHTVQVGIGTMTFQSCSAATFSYTFTGGSSTGLSGLITLGRIGPVPPGCTS